MTIQKFLNKNHDGKASDFLTFGIVTINDQIF